MSEEKKDITGAHDNLKVWEDDYAEWRPAFLEWQEDLAFYLGNQWDDTAKAKLLKEGRPVLSINKIKKPCDMITGYYRQNSADIHVYPIEGSDDPSADIYTQVIKWIMMGNSNKHNLPYAFDSAIHTGLGWIVVDVRYDEDLLNGDVYIRSGNPFHIVADPNFKEPDLSDCQHISRYSFMDKGELKSRWPDMAAEIDGLSESDPTDEYINQPKYKGKKIRVIERWYREWETKKVIVKKNESGVSEVVELGSGVLDAIKLAALKLAGAKVLQKQVCTIKMCTSVNDELVLYDGPNPLGINIFPFIPVFGWFTPDYNDWDLRVQGIVRIMKDLQREKNKRRSQMMSMVMKAPFGGMYYKKGSITNPNKLLTTTSGFDLIEVNDLEGIKPINPPVISEAMASLEQMFSSDIDQTGPNPDLLGTQMSKSEPGMNIQMRQKQGMMSIQEPFENMGFAKRILGKVLIAIINKNFEIEKIKAIVGPNTVIPPDWNDRKLAVKYDTAVDEIADTPSYRAGLYQMYQQMQQQGIPIPPEVMISVAEIPAAAKEQMKPLLEKQTALQHAQLDLQILQTKQMIDQILNPPPPPPMAPEQGGQTAPPPADGSQVMPVENTGQEVPTETVPTR